jgi:hypothetical protein
MPAGGVDSATGARVALGLDVERAGAVARGVAVATGAGGVTKVGVGAGAGVGVPNVKRSGVTLGRYIRLGGRLGVGVGVGAWAGTGVVCCACTTGAAMPAANAAAASPNWPPIRYLPRFTTASLAVPT